MVSELVMPQGYHHSAEDVKAIFRKRQDRRSSACASSGMPAFLSSLRAPQERICVVQCTCIGARRKTQAGWFIPARALRLEGGG